MKTRNIILLALLNAGLAGGQVNPAPVPAPPATATQPPALSSPISATVTQQVQLQTTVNTAALPGITVGVGPAWNRGAANPYAVDITVGIRLGATSNMYSWTDITTPIVKPGSGSSTGPVLSSVTTGLAYVLAQNKSGSISLLGIGQTGFATSTAGVSPSFTGSLAAAFKLGSKPMWVIPYFKAGNESLGTNGAVASFVIMPGLQFVVGLGKQ